MGPQFLKTPTGEELVVLPRREYDVLLARLGDEEAEDRLLGEIADRARQDLEAGRTILLPVWFSDGILARRDPVRIVREHFGLSPAEMAQAVGVPEARLQAMESGAERPTAAMLDAISARVDIDPRILSGIYDEVAAVA